MSAIVEVLQERPDLLHDAIEQAREDFALVRAIQEGEVSDLITRDEVFAIRGIKP